jgi:hypothetical protein
VAPPPAEQPAEAYAYEPAPPVAEPAVPVAGPPPTRPAPVEAEPIDLLALTGAKTIIRRFAPVFIVVVIVIALLVWLAIG